MKTRPRDAFDACLEIYKVARELVDERRSTMRLEASSKFLWRPDLRPRLVEYVADFALAGQRALVGEEDSGGPSSPPAESSAAAALSSATKVPNLLKNFRPRRRQQRLASRMILFRMHYLGGAEYQTARQFLGISEVNCADWVDEIKDVVGRELQRSGIFPLGRYFNGMASTARIDKRLDKRKRDASRRSAA